MLQEIVCSCCQKKILRKSMDGHWRISNKVMTLSQDGSGVFVVCKDCGHEEAMPFSIMMKSVQKDEHKQEYEEISRGPFLVRKKKTP